MFFIRTMGALMHAVCIPHYLQEAKINLPSIILKTLTGENYMTSAGGTISPNCSAFEINFYPILYRICWNLNLVKYLGSVGQRRAVL